MSILLIFDFICIFFPANLRSDVLIKDGGFWEISGYPEPEPISEPSYITTTPNTSYMLKYPLSF